MRSEKKPDKHYYRVISYKDGSGRKPGIVIKKYTEEQAKCTEWILERIDK